MINSCSTSGVVNPKFVSMLSEEVNRIDTTKPLMRLPSRRFVDPRRESHFIWTEGPGTRLQTRHAGSNLVTPDCRPLHSNQFDRYRSRCRKAGRKKDSGHLVRL